MMLHTEEITQQIAQTAKDFAAQYIKPHVMEWDETQTFPANYLKKWERLD